MASTVKPVPDGYHTLTPYLTVQDAAALLDFLKQAFDAVETFRMPGPDGAVRHAEARIGDSIVMVGQAREPWTPRPGTIYVYVPDVDATYVRALAAGARSVQAPATHFYGDRSGGVEDPQGTQWWIATHVEDVPPEELEKRSAAASS